MTKKTAKKTNKLSKPNLALSLSDDVLKSEVLRRMKLSLEKLQEDRKEKSLEMDEANEILVAVDGVFAETSKGEELQEEFRDKLNDEIHDIENELRNLTDEIENMGELYSGIETINFI